MSVRLLAPRVAMLARIRNDETETHIGVFGGDLVVNPFERFADYLTTAINSPNRYRLREIMTRLPGEPNQPCGAALQPTSKIGRASCRERV